MKKKLHVLFLCGWYPSKVLPTNGDFIQRHAEAVSLMHKVSVLHIISDKNLIQKSNIENKTINSIDTYIGYVKFTKNPFIKLIRFWKTYLSLLKKIDDFDIVHLNTLFPFGLFALHLKTFRKKPFIISEHWTGYLYPNSKEIGFIKKALSKIICEKASFICPVSNHLKNSMEDLKLLGNYKIVPNVVDTDLFVPKNTKNTTFNIVHISSMINHHKNIYGILEVAKELENKIEFSWKFIGGINPEIKLKITELNFKKNYVTFLPHLPHNKLISYLQNASVFVLFSNYENLPCVILESFSSGTPVISTNVGGIAEYFPNDFGKLIEKNNKEELFISLLKFYNDAFVDSKKMHQYAKDNFSKKTIAKKFSNLYQKSITDH